jgi:hypothetical protein
MALNITDYNKLRMAAVGVGGLAPAAAGSYLALATALPASPASAPLADYAAVELTTAGYARQAATWVADGLALETAAPEVFGPFAADPPEVTHLFLCDAASGTSGNVLLYGAWDTARDVGAGDTLTIAAGELTLAVT